MQVTLKDFQPFNNWKPDVDGKKYGDSEFPVDLIDKTTGRKYLNESKKTVKFKCFLLTLGTPIVHVIASVVTIAFRALRLATLSHFWAHRSGEKSYSIKNRLKDAGVNLLKIATQPITLVGLQLAAIYGLFRPFDGRKLYASIERAQYGSFVLAPCFQPDANKHLFGGNIHTRDAL